MTIRLFALFALVMLASCRPLLIFPGGKLEGSVSPAPTSWTVIADVKTVQLETAPQDPYSVNIWAIGMGPILYVHAGTNRTTWVENMEANPIVRVQAADKLYQLRAARVKDKAEFARFSDAYEQKYGKRPRNEDVTQAYLFRLEADS